MGGGLRRREKRRRVKEESLKSTGTKELRKDKEGKEVREKGKWV